MTQPKKRIAVVAGDGIGPEVIREAVRVLERVGETHGVGLELREFDWGAEKFLSEGVSLPEGALDMLSREFDAILAGAFVLGLAIMIFYPVFSVFPQEVIFRTFFFHRYAPLFTSTAMLTLASGLAFGHGHLLFRNNLALILCAIGGLVLSRTYARTNSTLACAVEHGLYGCIIFTVGLGRYFFLGAVVV